MVLPSCRQSEEHCTNFPVKTVIIEQWYRSKGDTSQGKRGQRILLKGDNITCGPNLERWMRVRLTSWDEHSGNNNTWEEMLTKKTMTHWWSAGSSAGLELWLPGGIEWGKQEVGLQGGRSREWRGHQGPCFSSCCCCLTNHPKLKAHYWLFLTVLQLGSSVWGCLISAAHDSGWHHSTGARGSTILTHMSGASAAVAVVGWVSLFLFSQPLSIQWSNSGFCTWKLYPRRAENGSHRAS